MIHVTTLLLLLLTHVCFGDSVTLRGEHSQTYQGVISSGSYDGLRFTIDGSGEGATLIPWSEVASFSSTRARPSLEQFRKDGERLWRARLRLERGDLLLAEPVFEQICHESALRDSHDARVAYEGYLRCLIARGKISEAIQPWLATARLEELGIKSPYPNLPQIVDTDTLLCPYLPPIWISNSSIPPLLNTFDDVQTPRLQQVINQLLNVNVTDETNHAQNILQMINDIGHQNEPQNSKPWLDLWRLWFEAIAILESNNSNQRKNALLNLAIVASKGKQSQPWLSCAAMYRLSDELNDDGKFESANQIIDDAKRSFPSHPLHHKDDFKIRNVSK